MKERDIDWNGLDDAALERLLWEDADGALSPGVKQRVQAHLDAHPEARARAGEIAALGERLGAVAEAEPPAELRSRIREALAQAGLHRPAPPRRGFLEVLRGGWNPSLAWGLASAAAGVLVGVLAAPLLLGLTDGVDPDAVSGTVRAPASAARRLEVPGLDGCLAVRREGERLAVEVRLADDDVSFTVEKTPEAGVFLLRVTRDGEVALQERLVLDELPGTD